MNIYFRGCCFLFLLCFSLPLGLSADSNQEPSYSLSVEMPGHIMGADTIYPHLSIHKGGHLDTTIHDTLAISLTKSQGSSKTHEIAFENGQATLPVRIETSETITFSIPELKINQSRNIHCRPPWTSLIPPLIAILLALVFREVITALFLGILSGLLLIKGFTFTGLLTALFRFVDHYLIKVLTSESHMAIIIFSLLIGGMVSLISANRGMKGLVGYIKKGASNIQRTQVVTWFVGILIFFDDYANTLIVGNTMRPLTDKFRISREKLAYLVDSTAAPIASIAFITTWIGAQLDYIQGATAGLPIDQNAYAIFFNSLNYAFYPVFSLIFILMLILSNREFGPMYEAEVTARKGQNDVSNQEAESGESEKGYALDALVPLLTLILTAFGSLLYTGYKEAVWSSSQGFFVKLAQTIGNANAYDSLLWASLTSLILAIIVTLVRRTLNLEKTVEHITEGFKSMLGALMILILAWSLALITENLDTAGFLANWLTGNINPFFLPGLIFVLSAAVSFATGSSWGTMAILYPLVLPMTYQAGVGSGLEHEAIMALFYHVVSVVLAGSVMGDHCSPLSDTTILSSLSTQCNHISHVRTQLPYALVVGAVSLVIGHFLTGFNWLPTWLAFLLGIMVMWILIRYIIGKPLHDEIPDA